MGPHHADGAGGLAGLSIRHHKGRLWGGKRRYRQRYGPVPPGAEPAPGVGAGDPGQGL